MTEPQLPASTGMTGGSYSVVRRIQADREHGASWLSREAARALVAAATPGGDAESRLAQTRALAHDLALARPSMAAIANTVSRIWWATEPRGEADAVARLDALRAEARDVEARWDAAVEGMTRWVTDATRTAAGAIYTLSRSGSVESALGALARLRATQDPLRVIVGESRPGGEGVALAQTLARAGAQVTLVADSACATFIDQAALVIVGADSVRADGSLVNKIGTRTLAVVARASGRPVYALAESLKITPASFPLVIEEMEPEELAPEPTRGLTPRNIYFDVTPADLITGVVTEAGLLDASDLARLAQQAERSYQALMRP